MQLPIVLFDGDKGGVGKSVVCGAFADYCNKQGHRIAVVDADARNPDVSRMFDGVVPVSHANLRVHDGWMDLMDFTMANPDCLITVSMPAGIGGEVKNEAKHLAELLRQSGRALALVWVINRTLDSINLLRETTAALSTSIGPKFVIKNLFFGDTEKFRRWDDSETRRQFEKTGGVTLAFPELHERVMDKLFANPDNIVPYTNAYLPVNEVANSVHGLSYSEMVEMNVWLNDVGQTCHEIAKSLGLLQEGKKK